MAKKDIFRDLNPLFLENLNWWKSTKPSETPGAILFAKAMQGYIMYSLNAKINPDEVAVV